MTSVLVLGDSIARGDGASSRDHSWVSLWLSTLSNTSSCFYFCRGGATSETARTWARYVWCVPPPEFVVLAYGMNDQTRPSGRFSRFTPARPNVSPEDYGRNTRAVVEEYRSRWSNAQIVLVAPFPAHPSWTGSRGDTRAYRDALARVASESGALLADVTTEWEKALGSGESPDNLFENRANHPSDAGHRIIADVLIGLTNQ